MSMIPTPPASLGISAAEVETLISAVASLVGGDQSPTGRGLALTMLDRAAARLNSAGVFLYARTTSTFSSLTADQSTLTLPSDFGWPTDPFLVKEADGTLLGSIEWLPYEEFKRASTASSNNSSVPQFATLESETATSAVINLYPPIDTGKVGSLEMTYFFRLKKPSTVSASEDLLMTEETEEALITWARALLIQHKNSDQPAIWGPWFQDAQNQAQLAKSSAHRFQQAIHMQATPDEGGRLPGSAYGGLAGGTAYLKLG